MCPVSIQLGPCVSLSAMRVLVTRYRNPLIFVSLSSPFSLLDFDPADLTYASTGFFVLTILMLMARPPVRAGRCTALNFGSLLQCATSDLLTSIAPGVVLTLGNSWAVHAVQKWSVRLQLPLLVSHILKRRVTVHSLACTSLLLFDHDSSPRTYVIRSANLDRITYVCGNDTLVTYYAILSCYSLICVDSSPPTRTTTSICLMWCSSSFGGNQGQYV